MSNTPDFLTTTDLLAKYDVLIDGAEVHGIICGMLCGGMTLDNQDWLAVLMDVSNNSVRFAPELVTHLRALYDTTVAQLTDVEFGLEMCIPDTDATLSEQGQGLILWVQGFMLGFGLHQPSLESSSDDVKEGLQDFSEIALMESIEDEDEDTQAQLLTLIEHVRIIAMSCFNECQPARKAMPIETDPTVH
jgi:uncharacterized protein